MSVDDELRTQRVRAGILDDDRVTHSGREWGFAAGLMIIVAVYLAHAWSYIDYVNDDAYITFRYSRFLALGRGPYFNVGEHIEGYTNFLLMLVLAPIIALGSEAAGPIAAKCIGIASGAGSIVLAGMLARRLAGADDLPGARPWVAGLVAAGLVAASPAFALNSTSGLETTLFGFLVTCAVALGVKRAAQEGSWGMGPAFAAAALTRPEGLLFFAITWGSHLLLGASQLRQAVQDTVTAGRSGLRRHPWLGQLVRDALIVLTAIVGQLVFRLIAYDGQWLPNTYYAKAGGFWKTGAATYIGRDLLLWFLGPVGLCAGAFGWLTSRASRGPGVPVALVALSGTCLPFVTGTDWMLGSRMIVPFLPLVAVIVAIGWWRLAALLLRKPIWLGPLLLLSLLPAVWSFQGEARAYYDEYIAIRARGYATGHRALADWLRNGAALPGETIALMDIGMVGYLCIDQNILDISGLTDAYIARSPGTFLDKHYDVDYVLKKKPERIVLVFTAPTTDGSAPTAAQWTRWNDTEERFYRNAEFQEHYVSEPQANAGADLTLTGLAKQFGAERVFDHAHPGRFYLLAVFRRRQ